MESSTSITPHVDYVYSKKKSNRPKRKLGTVLINDDAGRQRQGHITTRGMREVLDNSRRWTILIKIFEEMIISHDRKIEKTLAGDILASVALKSDCSIQTVSNIWSEFYLQRGNTEINPIHMISRTHEKALKDGTQEMDSSDSLQYPAALAKPHKFNARYDMSGIKHSPDEVVDMVLDVNKKTKGQANIRSMVVELERLHNISVPKTTLNRMLQSYLIPRHNSYLHPALSKKNKYARCVYCFDMIDWTKLPYMDSDNVEQLSFDQTSYKRTIYLDEKIFTAERINAKVYATKEGFAELPPRRARKKNKQPQIMFLLGLGCPQMSPDDRVWFDGKIGVFPSTELKHAIRNSKNRLSGALEVVEVTVDSEVFYDLMTMKNGFLETLKSEVPWLVSMGVTCLCVMDNAKPHIGKKPGSVEKRNIERLNDHCANLGMNITFVKQPPQSPDLNLLDASVNRSLSREASDYEHESKTNEKVLQNVHSVFENYSADKIIRAIATQFEMYRQILKAHGDNSFPMPHSEIRKRQDSGENEFNFEVRKDVVLSAAEWILEETKSFADDARSTNAAMGGSSKVKQGLVDRLREWEGKVEKWNRVVKDLS